MLLNKYMYFPASNLELKIKVKHSKLGKETSDHESFNQYIAKKSLPYLFNEQSGWGNSFDDEHLPDHCSEAYIRMYKLHNITLQHIYKHYIKIYAQHNVLFFFYLSAPTIYLVGKGQGRSGDMSQRRNWGWDLMFPSKVKMNIKITLLLLMIYPITKYPKVPLPTNLVKVSRSWQLSSL